MPANESSDDSRAPATVPARGQASRRGFLLSALGVVIAGCSSSGDRAEQTLPGPAWDLQPMPEPLPPLTRRPPVYAPPAMPAGIRSRASWASGNPVPSLMDRMTPIRYVTLHHDGMTPFYGDSAAAAAARLDLIRRAHRRERWGDIGYHFAVDRAGNVWEARPLQFQGAHVKDHNPGNIGIVALGNFEQQRPTQAQLEAVHRHVRAMMNTFGVPPSRLRTHQEWAATACPGRHMQRVMVASRASGRFG